MNSWDMFGLDTLEIIDIGDGRSKLPIELCEGPKVWHSALGGASDKLLYLYPEHLKLLYDRFRKANPKGVIFGIDGSFDEYAPSGLSKKELDRLQEERKIFVSLFLTDEGLGYPHARKYLPELFEPNLINKMAADPWLNVDLLDQAIRDGHVPDGPGESSRWSPEWRAYCDRVIAIGSYM